jgi:hypothetical protein
MCAASNCECIALAFAALQLGMREWPLHKEGDLCWP